jgi:spore maturation protein CgeB
MTATRYSFVILGLSMTSAWGNGHATTYRALVRQLVARGHDVLFLERDLPFYRNHRDLPNPSFGRTELYGSREELYDKFGDAIRNADVAMLGSYVPEGTEVGQWLVDNAAGHKLFYDIDTPITLRNLATGKCEYLSLSLVPRFDLYLSFTGGPTLSRIERSFGARRARPLYCSVDPELYFPESLTRSWELGYLGTFSPDRQPTVDRFLLMPARALPGRSFVVAGAQYPDSIRWPDNVKRIDHVPPNEHRAFYCAQRFTLNTTRRDMIAAGYSPSVRLFEASACGTPIISDDWAGIETFFVPGLEILIAKSPADVASFLTRLSPEDTAALASRARKRVLAEHTAAHRAEALEGYLADISTSRRAGGGKTVRKAATNEAEP